MDTKEQQARVIVSNLALIQAQAVVVAFCASLFAIVLAWVPKGVVGSLDLFHRRWQTKGLFLNLVWLGIFPLYYLPPDDC